MKIERPSFGLVARLGKSIPKQSEGRAGEKYLPVGGRVRKLRAVEDQSAPIPGEIVSELDGSYTGWYSTPIRLCGYSREVFEPTRKSQRNMREGFAYYTGESTQ
jgi:hypothetical protein